MSDYIWDPISETWKYNPGGAPPAPLVMPPGKQLVGTSTLTLKGIDNQTLDLTGLPQGSNKLGTAALASAQSFQPAGTALNLVGIDTTSTIVNGTGSKTFTVATGLGFTTGMIVTAIETANPQAYMQGSVTSYSSTTLVINSTYSQGTFTGTGWTIQISGPQGPIGATGGAGVPVGAMLDFAGSTPPTSFLLCDGSQVNRTTYAALFAVIGTTWGAGDGSTTFNLPDARARIGIGAGQSATHEGGGTGTNRVLGVSGGAETHTQSAAELVSHNHTIYITDPGHSHELTSSQSGGGGVSSYTQSGAGPNGYTYPATTGISASESAEGSSSPMAIMNPFYVATKIIRYA